MPAVSGDRRRKVLVVDDEREMVSLFARILSAENVEILRAGSAAEALRIAQHTRLDLVILDVKLPDSSGIDVLKRLRAMDEGVPIIIATSYGSRDTVRASMRLGAFDYLTKPFDNNELLRVAREALVARVPGAIQPERGRGGA